MHTLTPPSEVKIKGDAVMIVVHESTYDARFATKRGIDEAVRYAKANRIPVIYLIDDAPEDFYFMEDCNPDYWVFSHSGEVPFPVDVEHLYIAGGHFELCMSHSLHDITFQQSRQEPKSRTVTYFMDAVYSNGKLIESDAPYFRAFDRFMGIVTYGRPGGEHWPKLSMLETMGVIRNRTHQQDYLEKVLPRWDTTFSEDYRIEIQLEQTPNKVLRWGDGWLPPTISFRFFDSAQKLNEYGRRQAYRMPTVTFTLVS